MEYAAGRQPHVTVTWSWREIRYNYTYRVKTPKGTVSVYFSPHRDSKRPPTHDAEITHPYTEIPVIIRSPKALPVLVEIGDGPGYVSAAYVQVNGRAAAFANGRVGLNGGRNSLVITYPDAE